MICIGDWEQMKYNNRHGEGNANFVTKCFWLMILEPVVNVLIAMVEYVRKHPNKKKDKIRLIHKLRCKRCKSGCGLWNRPSTK